MGHNFERKIDNASLKVYPLVTMVCRIIAGLISLALFATIPYAVKALHNQQLSPLIVSTVIFTVTMIITVVMYQRRIAALTATLDDLENQVPSPADCGSLSYNDIFKNFYDDEEYDEKMRQMVYANAPLRGVFSIKEEEEEEKEEDRIYIL